jgi:hypothetical protein
MSIDTLLSLGYHFYGISFIILLISAGVDSYELIKYLVEST